MFVLEQLPLILMTFSHVEHLQDSVQWLSCSNNNVLVIILTLLSNVVVL